MMTDARILACEVAYYNCFCTKEETTQVIHYRDEAIPDMYYHNFTYIKTSNDTSLACIIANELALRRASGSSFLMVLTDQDLRNEELDGIQADVSRNGYYLFDHCFYGLLKEKPGVVIKQAKTPEQVEDILYSDLQLDEENLGRDFCQRRCYRRGEVYVKDGGVDSYVCYHDGQVIGACDLFIHKGIAKIEDFCVIPIHQRKGYGTALLKHLIGIAMAAGCTMIYLVTDEDNTAKHMYQKIGFTKIGERTDLFFSLEKY